jgi:hypothetical protein
MIFYTPFIKNMVKGVIIMKGYVVESGYMGYMDGHYYLFADESDYREAYQES